MADSQSVCLDGPFGWYFLGGVFGAPQCGNQRAGLDVSNSGDVHGLIGLLFDPRRPAGDSAAPPSYVTGAMVMQDLHFRFVASIDPSGVAPFIRWVALGAGALYVLLGFSDSSRQTAPEYFGCLLVVIAGLSLVSRANDLLSLFLALEMISIPTYVLLYVGRHDLPFGEIAGVGHHANGLDKFRSTIPQRSQ